MLPQCVEQSRAGIKAQTMLATVNLKFNRYWRHRRLGMARYQNYPLKDSLKQRVWDFIARAGHAPDTDPEGRA